MKLDIVIEKGVEILTLDSPPMNTLDIPAVVAIGDYFSKLSGQRPLIITGQGKAFSAGVDTNAYAAYSTEQRGQLFCAISTMVQACRSISTPVIAAINGHAIGGGFVLALCADYRIVTTGSHKFGLTEARAGVPFPEGAVAVIKREIPLPLLRKLALTSCLISPDFLVENHILDEMVEPHQLMDSAIDRARELYQQKAFAEVKRQIMRE
jgi:enoyl-CoA hydratase